MTRSSTVRERFEFVLSARNLDVTQHVSERGLFDVHDASGQALKLPIALSTVMNQYNALSEKLALRMHSITTEEIRRYTVPG